MLEDVTVDLGAQTLDPELHLFAQLPGQIAHHAWKAACGIGERTHAADDNFVVQPLTEPVHAPIECVKFHQLITQ